MEAQLIPDNAEEVAVFGIPVVDGSTLVGRLYVEPAIIGDFWSLKIHFLKPDDSGDFAFDAVATYISKASAINGVENAVDRAIKHVQRRWALIGTYREIKAREAKALEDAKAASEQIKQDYKDGKYE